ncbi:SusF/SusE family outer membrane protein [Lewinella sp. IMCC34191]|uniref:SusF/SusE family outer membrane protein n=1 Tax=Lewinella sp. IMCC34191 TaxID=2259172 RepID=UPI000E246184|nr:SusF/SusE family outer membrane protein [Lewinella sp. IMCC34191]
MQLSKQLLSWLPLLLLLTLVVSCDRDEIDLAANTDFPPAILSSSPSPDGRVVAGDFDIRVVFADGSISPLQSGTVTLMDSAMTEIASASENLEGLQDSIVIQGLSFDAENLALGIYNMSVSVTDTKGQTTESTFSFEISNLPYPANYDAIYLAGAFNGWTPSNNQLTLIGPNLWEIQEVDLQGEAWKLVDGPEFGGEDFGDPECDGFMNSNQAAGGNGDTNCGASGPVNIRFNDETLSYSVTPTVSFASQTMGLYLLGTFNNFTGSDYQFTLIEDNTWELGEVLLEPGAQFKMAEMPDFVGINYGDDNNDGVAQVGGSNIVYADSLEKAYYSITFNDLSLAYELEFLRLGAPESVGILGDALPDGFISDVDMVDEGNGVYTINIELTDGVVKFRANDNWDLNWGGTEFPSGTAVVGGSDIPVVAGTYNVTLDINNLTYSFVEDAGITSVGLVGSASPGGWDDDIQLVDQGDGTWSAIIGLGEGVVKFRANGNWDVNWGGADFPNGTGTQNGSDITVSPGIYIVTLTPASGAYSFEAASIGLIGSATSTAWTSDTDMTPTGVVGEVSLTTTLTAGDDAAVKFRVNDDWAYNWGGTEFPRGTAVFNTPDNIPVTTSGEYTVTFNVNTLEYSFD